MFLKVGIIGLPNAGKSTLFNALVRKQEAAVGKHPFTTVEPNKGVVDVPDKRLDKLYLMMSKDENQPKVRSFKRGKTPAALAFVDIAGLIKGAHKGEGLGSKFLHYIREVDLLLHTVREFEDKTVAHVHSKIDPENDLEIVQTELILKDLETVEGQLEEKRSELIKEIGRSAEKVLRKIKKKLNKGKLVKDMELTKEEQQILSPLFLLTAKPEIVVYNIGENQRDLKPGLKICSKLEEELAGLAWVERRQYIKEFGLPEPALDRVIKACYKKLDLITFYTIAGGKEVRAWAIKKGSTAYEAAGKIHTDMQKGFIKAEAVNADDLLKIGLWNKAKEMGKIQMHGRDYIVKDKDVLEIKFN